MRKQGILLTAAVLVSTVSVPGAAFAHPAYPSSAESARAAVPRVLMLPRDDFADGNSDGWTMYGGSWSVKDGRLVAGRSFGGKAVLDDRRTDLTYDADVLITSNSGDAGIVFRVTEPGVGADAYRGYYAGITASGRVILGKADRSWRELGGAALTGSPAAQHHLRVTAKGSELRVYVDRASSPAISTTDSTFSSGRSGVRVFNSAASFDNVDVVSASPVVNPNTPAGGAGLADPAKKDIAMQIVSSAENSTLDWRAQYSYIEDIGDGRGYTGGIIGFTSGTSDMLALVEAYTKTKPTNPLAKYLPALRRVNGSDSHDGLGADYVSAWKQAATDSVFRNAQDSERDSEYFTPSVATAKADGLGTLGQFIYYDAIVMHGPGEQADSFGGIRRAAMSRAKTPAQGGNETTYLSAFLDERERVMRLEEAHADTSRVSTAQRVWLKNGNLALSTPLEWRVYGDPFRIG